MKKKIFLATGAFVAVCCGSALFLHLNQEAKPLSDLALANIEALSGDETTPVTKYQSMGYCTPTQMNYKCITTKTAELCSRDCK